MVHLPADATVEEKIQLVSSAAASIPDQSSPEVAALMTQLQALLREKKIQDNDTATAAYLAQALVEAADQ